MKRLLTILFLLPMVVKAQFPTKYKFLPTPVIDTPGDYSPKPDPPPIGIDTFTYSTTDITDTYTTPAISGTFDLYLKVVDPESYRLPLPLKITGRGAGGAYYLKTIVL